MKNQGRVLVSNAFVDNDRHNERNKQLQNRFE